MKTYIKAIIATLGVLTLLLIINIISALFEIPIAIKVKSDINKSNIPSFSRTNDEPHNFHFNLQ